MEVSLVERGGAQRFPTVFWVTYTTYPSIKTSFLSLKKKKKNSPHGIWHFLLLR